MAFWQWYDGKVTLERSYLFGSFAAGLVAGIALCGWGLPKSVSWEEINDLEPVPRESPAFPGTWHLGPFVCDDDCSGHLAGWRWARKHRLTSVADCHGTSGSFVEGCVYFVGVMGYEPDATF